MYKIIIDANVWIKYARSKDIAPLLKRIIAYNFLPVVNNYLLSEIFNALLENKWMNEKKASLIIEFIKKISLVVSEKAVYGIVPDPKDNYLFNLAVQNRCYFMITDDSKLLEFTLRPIPVSYLPLVSENFSGCFKLRKSITHSKQTNLLSGRQTNNLDFYLAFTHYCKLHIM